MISATLTTRPAGSNPWTTPSGRVLQLTSLEHSRGRSEAASERARISAEASERLRYGPSSMTGPAKSVTRVSGINRNPCVRHGPRTKSRWRPRLF